MANDLILLLVITSYISKNVALIQKVFVMTGFITGKNRQEVKLFPERLNDYIIEDDAVRVIDVFFDCMTQSTLGFKAGQA